MNKLKQVLSESFQICFGILLASIGLKAFLLPNGFLDGGVTGIAILISQLFDLNISIVLLIVSIPFLLICVMAATQIGTLGYQKGGIIAAIGFVGGFSWRRRDHRPLTPHCPTNTE